MVKKIVEKYNQLGSYLFFKKLVGYEAVFTCAIRKKDIELFEGNIKSNFCVMPINKDYWCADPLFYEYNGKTVLFFELFKYKDNKGDIACCEILNGRFTEPKVIISEDFHLSFPNVFVFDDQLYMIPESEASKGITIYKCSSFPEKWELLAHIKTQIPIVDCIVDRIDENIISFIGSTFEYENPKITKFVSFKINMHNLDAIFYDETSNNQNGYSYMNRNAGRYIDTNSKKIYCVQTSSEAIYGYSLKFVKDNLLNKECDYKKQYILEILPENIRLNNFNKKIIGVHTYSQSREFEAIDIEYLHWNPLKWIYRVFCRGK